MHPVVPTFRFPNATLLALLGALATGPAAGAARAQGAGDTTQARRDTTRRQADSTLQKLFAPGGDFGIKVNGRFEFRDEQVKNERCVASQLFAFGSQCRPVWNLSPAFQFALKTGGTLADRIRTNVDYDSRREFDGANLIALSYEGKPHEWLQRVDVGNVTFAVPSSRFITSGIPQGNYGVQATAQFGRWSVRAIAAEQKGIVQRDRVFTVGGTGTQAGALDVDDYQVEARRFFFTVDPRRFSGWPNVDILDGTRLSQLAAQLPDSVRPVRVSLYRLVIGGQPPNPNGPQFRLIGDPSSRKGPIYEPLRENVDYVVDPSQLWVALAQPLDPNKERLVVAYTVRIAGRDTTVASTGGTPDVQRVDARDQFAALLWDPSVQPTDPAFVREIRSVYRLGGEGVRRETVRLTIATGGTFDQERPVAGRASTFLELFGLSRLGVAADFDAENRIWPRRADPVVALASSATATVLRDKFVVFPSAQPFARAGLAGSAGNPSNDAIYVTPGQDLYSALHPQPAYRLRFHFETDGGADAMSFALGSTQVRPASERLVLDDGTVLRRNIDYTIDYDLGRVTMLRSDSLAARARQVTVKFEETPLFVTTPTSIFGVASQVAFTGGAFNLVAIGQRQHSSFTRPQLGYADESAIVAGASVGWGTEVPALARLAKRISAAGAAAQPSRFRLDAEVAMSRPLPTASGQAYLESFENDGGIPLSLNDAAWGYSSQPALGRTLAGRLGGASVLDLSHAATMAWQTIGKTLGDSVIQFALQEIDPLTKFAGTGFVQPEQVLWLTLYPLSVGGAYDDNAKRYRWNISGAPAGRRWRSIVQRLGSQAGVNLTGKETVEFWALVDTNVVRRGRNPTIVLDIGDVSEDGVALVPTQLTVSGSGSARDSVWAGRALVGRDTLQSERDPFSRAFNQEKNDTGLPGDVIPRLLVSSPDGSGLQTNVKLCSRGNLQVARLGDTRTNCTVGNGRLDEWDLDGDNVLNFDSSQREQERLFRYVADLSDQKTWTRVGGCRQAPNDPAGAAAPKLCWVLVRLPFAAPADTINGGPSVLRVRAARLTMVSGDRLGDAEFSQVVIAELKFAGAAWLKRSDRAITGIAGDRQGTGRVNVGTVGTLDSLSSLGYQSPPGVVDQPDKKLTGLENQQIVINERSMRITATDLAPLERAEAFITFPEGARNVRQYSELRVWARGRGSGWGVGGDLQFFIKLGRDPNSFYAYRTPANAGATPSAWLPEVRVDFARFTALRARLENAYLQNRGDTLSCSGTDLALIAQSVASVPTAGRRYAVCDAGYIVYAADPVVSPPNLTAVQELAVGMVRTDSSSGASRIVPGDTLELWVDDIRLAGLVSTPGYAAQIAARANLGDVADLRVALTNRDPNFRQLGEAPTYVGDQQLDVTSTVRLDRLMGGSGEWAIPVTANWSTGTSSPEFLTQSDLRASDVAGVRTPERRTTSLSIGVRRATPMAGGLLASLVNHLAVNAGGGGTNARSEFQTADESRVNAGADFAIGGDSPEGVMPAWWTGMFDRLPSWLAGADLVRAMRDAKPRTQPLFFRASGAFASSDESRSSFLSVAPTDHDTARTVVGRQHLWRNASTLEVRPFDALAAKWEVSSTRDLLRYGDTTATARAATDERATILGLDAGLERERAITSTYTLTPRPDGWIRPRLEFATSYGYLRDPTSRILLHEGDTTGALRLPRRVTATQTWTAASAFDVAKEWNAAARITPVEVTVTRTLAAGYDGTPRTSGFGLQFGLGGEGTYLSDGGTLATTAASTAQVALASGLKIMNGVTLDVRTQRLATRNWLRRPDQSETVVDGDLVTLPQLTLRGTFHPQAFDAVVTGITATAQFVATQQHSTIPGSGGTGADVRAGRTQSYPFALSFAWNDKGALVTGASFATTHRTDSLPGSALDSWSHEFGADATRSFKLPREWELKSDLRARLAWQQSVATGYVSTAGTADAATSRIVDNGRNAVSLNADTDVADNLTFSLQASRITTFDNNLNRRITQTVLSAVLQLSFFAGVMR